MPAAGRAPDTRVFLPRQKDKTPVQTFAERFDTTTASRTKFEPEAVLLQDQGLWPGLRLEEWRGSGGEMPETVLFQHGVMLHHEALTSARIHWSGHRPVTGDFAPGSFGIFPAGLSYSGHARGRWRGVVLGLTPGLVQAVSSSPGARTVELVPGNGIRDGFVWQASLALAADIREGYPGGAIYGESIAVALAAYLRRHHAADPRLQVERIEAGDALRRRVQQFILDQLQEKLTLAEMAAFVQLDVYSFARWFKRAFGMPPHRYLTAARIARARTLLLRTELSLVEIALQCGFSSQSHLSSAFRRFAGIAPGSYRARGRE